MQPEIVIDDFHRRFYEAATEGRSWGGATWMGFKLWKSPLDLMLYQELIWELKPRLIVETGTAFGGSALFFAHLLDQLGVGKVLSVDVKPVIQNYPKHPRIAYLGGRSSVDKGVLREVEGYVNWHCNLHVTRNPVLVILDSDHSRAHVTQELNAYSPFVPPNSWMVVEDVNVNGHPVYPKHGPGPREALDVWLPDNTDFREDTARASKYLFSMHAWLRRRRE